MCEAFGHKFHCPDIYHKDILIKGYPDINSRMSIKIEKIWKPPKLSRVLAKVDFGR